MADMSTIETQAWAYAEARRDLKDKVAAMEAEIAEVRGRHVPAIKDAAAHEAFVKGGLESAVKAGRDLFERPKTRELHGIRVGFRKLVGKLTIADEARTVAAIRRLMPDQVKTLIKVTEKPVRAALNRLSAAELKRLGVNVGDTTDAVVVEPADGDLDKVVKALLESEEG